MSGCIRIRRLRSRRCQNAPVAAVHEDDYDAEREQYGCRDLVGETNACASHSPASQLFRSSLLDNVVIVPTSSRPQIP